MAPSSSSSATATSVQVALRIRPTTKQDQSSIPARFQRSVIHASSPNTVAVELTPLAVSGPGAAPAPAASSASKKQYFSFDQVHPPPTTQYDLYSSTARPLVSRFLEGFNCTILAYGQTSSGKTYTMTGVDLDADPANPNNGMGIIPRAVSSIFATAKQFKDDRAGAWSYSVKASFIEIYNEDLIDLLTIDDASGGRREVQIREDKDGHIIWGGLREMNVRNAAEVMSLIRKGTAIRRTNETDMNAQSSRSHAIFSLTLTQKRYSGANLPPRSPSPFTNGCSPSRLARPGSMYTTPSSANRASSPTLGRPATPSFAAAMGRGGLRPSSALGHRGSMNGSTGGGGDEESEWVTITSKFHFVDLAGSERLKRTAAAGERIREGISINSGLLALGNVISALGDPSRSKTNTASHIPYRDSKLTRLLQDSLGGNAHTLMIACVSPAEYNANETINTLKYANRARNIKNHAVLNEKEDGWDDVEWLQSTVSRLRKELKALKEAGGGPSAGNTVVVQQHEQQESPEANKKMIAQMSELRNNYEDMRAKYAERTEELTRLRRELADTQRGSTGGAIVGTARYEEIVGPVIEEYEKTISAMEAELGLNRAALRHTNDMYEEKEEELAAITERHAATELYVEELRTRVAKITEREASTEAYIRDLEEKLKSYDESTMTSHESMTDLKREVSRFRDAETHSGKYIAELEARLARSDESVITLQQTVEKFEAECDRRRDEVRTLEARLEELRLDGEGWRTDLEARERRVRELEARLREWEQKKDDANDARVRLGNVVGHVTTAKKNLQLNLVATGSSAPPTPTEASAPSSPVTEESSDAPADPNSIETQFFSLQQTHKATLADLSTVSAKYRDALREISDLAAQIQEVKLSSTNVVDSGFMEVPGLEKPLADIPHISRRRMPGGRSRESSGELPSSQERRLLYRQAASAESLRARPLSHSQSLSQELNTAHLRKASFSSHGSSHSHSHSPSSSHSGTSPHLSYLSAHGSRPNLSISISSPHLNNFSNERSPQSLEKEIMRLQEVLKERETEIMLLEASLKESRAEKVAMPTVVEVDADEVHPSSSSANRVNGRVIPSFPQTGVPPETPSEASGFGSPSVADTDESLERLNEIMLSMAQKESQHREVVDGLNSQLAQVQRQLDDLITLSRDQAINMSNEMEGLRRKHADDLALLDEARGREAELQESLEKVHTAYGEEVERLRCEHQKALESKGCEVDELVTRIRDEHGAAIASLRGELTAASVMLEKSHREHEETFGALQAEHESEFRRQVQAAKDALEETQAEHAKALAKVKAEHVEVLKQKEAEASAVLQRTEEEYYDALTKIRGDHAETLKKLTAELNATLERLRDEHASEMKMAEIARQGSFSESQTAQAAALQELRDAQTAAIARKEACFSEEMDMLKSEHVRALNMQAEDHTTRMNRLRLEYEGATGRLREESRIEVDRLLSELKDAKDEVVSKTCKAQKELDATVQAAKEQQAAALAESRHVHEKEILQLRSQHESTLKEATARSDERVASIAQSHTEETSKLKAEHQRGLAEVDATLDALRQEHHQDLEALQARQDILAKEKESLAVMLAAVQDEHGQNMAHAQERYDRALGDTMDLQSELTTVQENHHQDLIAAQEQNRQFAEERQQFIEKLEVLSKKHVVELQKLRMEHDTALQEVHSHKAAADEYRLIQDQTKRQHELTLNQQAENLARLQKELHDANGERDELEAEAARLRGELDKTRSEQSKLIQEASKRQSLVDELERHRSILAEMQETLQKVKDEKDAIQMEKMRVDSLVRDLQAQVARGTSPTFRSGADRNLAYARGSLSPIKLPPPTPPPAGPPPPAPIAAVRSALVTDGSSSVSSHSSSTTTTSYTSSQSQPESPSTSVGSVGQLTPTPAPVDTKMTLKLEQRTKQLEEQEVMIKTLNKQLTHCESDLQAHMDLVTTLETSLGDSEKNLRKARMHATELARERDTLNTKIQTLQNELSEARREVATVRRSIVEEKQSLEQRLDEERKAKERARQQLDQRMEELQKRKSKFACL